MPLDPRKIEAALGRDVRRYLEDPDPEGKRSLISDLEYLLTWLWESQGLPGGRWFDGLSEFTITATPPDRLEVRGLMVWATRDDVSRQWIEVFAAELGVASYILRLGRKGVEERRIPYEHRAGLRRDLEQPQTWEWAFVFRNPEASG